MTVKQKREKISHLIDLVKPVENGGEGEKQTFI